MAAPPLTSRELLRLAVPSVAMTVLTFGFRTVDQLWVKGLSVDAQAAVGASVFVVIAAVATFEIAALGAAPLIARATGAQDPVRRAEVLGSALAVALGVGVAVSALGVAFAEPLGRLLGLNGGVHAEFVAYVRTLSLTALPLTLTPLVDAAFLAMGTARAPMLLQGLSLLLNLLLTPLLIYPEVAGLPGADLGIAGAALASNLSRGVTTGAGLWLLAREVGLRAGPPRLGPSTRQIFTLGTPMAFGTLMYAGVYWAMLRTSISPLGPAVNAALGIGFSALEGVTWPTFHGLALAVSSFVGRSLGAGDPARAWAAIRLALPWSTGLGLAATAAFALGGAELTGWFSADAQVHAEATLYASTLAWSQLLVSWEALAEGVLAGAGATRTVAVLSVPFNLVRVPLAWALAFPLGMGANGVWWAINATSALKALSKGAAVASGAWARKEL